MAGSLEECSFGSYPESKEEYASLSKLLLEFNNICKIDQGWVCKTGTGMTLRIAMTIYQMTFILFASFSLIFSYLRYDLLCVMLIHVCFVFTLRIFAQRRDLRQ